MQQSILEELGISPFRPRAPWLDGDLQTLRDTLRAVSVPDPQQGQALQVPLEGGASLLALLDRPIEGPPHALVLLSHGLGGSSESQGTRRLAMALRLEGFAVLRLNLRGAGEGRALAPGSYAAECNRDLLPVLQMARRLAAELGMAGAPLPLAGAGISLGGAILLNAEVAARRQGESGLDALACLSSPLDLEACSRQFERRRNRLYQRWLVRRLRQQVLEDPYGIEADLRRALSSAERPRSIRAFDALVTAPRWGHASVEAYYTAASPLRWLTSDLPLPPILVLQAIDDPWVPADAALSLQQRRLHGEALNPRVELCLPESGGHNGFHAPGDSPNGCWSDRLTARWLRKRLSPGR
ncbi:YheT family hydrolase [Synechococcus sp. CBW1004]|uniref:YheT family hydrolase n=1 Tax=Synechococcus sp. CBW1004 TaxID=1353136 RepID=UPI0018CE269D|nr:alpha/beta fold hydrolase [Synechococcus sp. CBW1004]QPN64384.1 alpha/beta hydrolase [Synechococcus sp. CBW1004]